MKYRIVDAKGPDYYNDVDLYPTLEAAETALQEARDWAKEAAKTEPSWANAQLEIEEVAE